MRFLDLDLDFFLNKNAYCGGYDGGRLGPEYKPWSVSEVRHFLEYRCGLSPDASVQGRTVESHDGILDFWRTLIESNKLKVPFEVIHIDAHPDLCVVDGLYLTSKFLYIDSRCGLAMLKKKHFHPGNYLTFAIVCRWIGSLAWITLRKHLKDLTKWDGDARSSLIHLQKRKGEYPNRSLSIVERDFRIPFQIMHWRKYRTNERFNYIAFSRSPNFTPPESDELIPVIEEYMRQI